MPYGTNGRDGRRVYFEDDGGDGAPVVLHGGLLDSVADLRESAFAQALPSSGFRLVYVDHRGLGSSDKPHDPEAYAMPLRVADAVAVLDQLGIERAHFIGQSWGGRLGFGIGEHAPQRVRSLVIGGNQPYRGPTVPSCGPSPRRFQRPARRAWRHWSAPSRASGRSGSPRLKGRAGSTTTPLRSRPPGAQQWPKVRSPKTYGAGGSRA
jgi:pimeloyl-ACP methyl ester carboxylesterase